MVGVPKKIIEFELRPRSYNAIQVKCLHYWHNARKFMSFVANMRVAVDMIFYENSFTVFPLHGSCIEIYTDVLREIDASGKSVNGR